jgi:hypothetical protein
VLRCTSGSVSSWRNAWRPTGLPMPTRRGPGVKNWTDSKDDCEPQLEHRWASGEPAKYSNAALIRCIDCADSLTT